MWRPSRSQWATADGVVWRRRRRGLSEREAKRLIRRTNMSVAVEEASVALALTWLGPDDRIPFWNAHVAGHVDDGPEPVARNAQGLTYHVSTWRSDTGERLVLLSASC